MAEHCSYVCALMEPEEHWANPVGVWAQFQQLIPPEVGPARLLLWQWLSQGEGR